MSVRDDPSWAATRDDLRRLAWVLALVWLALTAFTALAQRYLGWRLAVGLVGGAGLLFSIGLLLVAAGSVAAASFERRRSHVKLPPTAGRTSGDS